MYKLIIEDDEGKTTVVPLIRDEITIGRKEGNTIRLTERNVSRRHARLSRTNGTVYIEDLESFNGIRVNGDRISGRAPVTEGDRIQIGDYQLALKLDKALAEAEHAALLAQAPGGSLSEDRGEKTAQFVVDEAAVAAARTASEAPTRSNPIIHGPAAAPAAGPGAEPDRPAKLVVVSSNFAAQEFRLDKPQCVIGRTEENDVVINHRSISRHHAKIVREQGRYQIVDLGSANGVRVNGEDYGKVELRRGDLIDLGHVRLRFVAPGEDFVFARDAQVVDVAAAGEAPARGLLLYLAGGAGLLAVVGLTVLINPCGGRAGETRRAGEPGSASGAFADIDRALAAERWDEALSAIGKAMASDPGNPGLRERKTQAESERKAEAVYARFARAVADRDNDAAVTPYQELPEGSVYHRKAQDSWPAVQAAYVKDHLGRARDLADGGRCDEAKKHLEAVLLVDDSNAAARELVTACGAGALAARPGRAAPPRPGPTPQPRPERAPDRSPERLADRAPERSPERLGERSASRLVDPSPDRGDRAPTERSGPVERPAAAPAARPAVAPAVATTAAPAAGGADPLVDAQDRYVHGDYQAAIDKARRALRDDPGNTRAWRLIGASSCFLKDKAGASTAWNKLGNIERQFLKYVCQRNNITLP
jgi:pSer/pThr/pTyr-binding forkhead associated (FHA) protein